MANVIRAPELQVGDTLCLKMITGTWPTRVLKTLRWHNRTWVRSKDLNHCIVDFVVSDLEWFELYPQPQGVLAFLEFDGFRYWAEEIGTDDVWEIDTYLWPEWCKTPPAELNAPTPKEVAKLITRAGRNGQIIWKRHRA